MLTFKKVLVLFLEQALLVIVSLDVTQGFDLSFSGSLDLCLYNAVFDHWLAPSKVSALL